VVLRSGAALTGKGASEELRRHCAARLAAFKVPKAVELVDGLPRSTTGKLLRRELRDAADPVRDAGDAD
jgi:acyl-coenzyme A synthetase/AMP-(fatty) acid ligase